MTYRGIYTVCNNRFLSPFAFAQKPEDSVIYAVLIGKRMKLSLRPFKIMRKFSKIIKTNKIGRIVLPPEFQKKICDGDILKGTSREQSALLTIIKPK